MARKKTPKTDRKQSELFDIEEIDKLLRICMEEQLDAIHQYDAISLREAWARIMERFNMQPNHTVNTICILLLFAIDLHSFIHYSHYYIICVCV